MQPNLDLKKAKELINKSKIIFSYIMLSTEEGQYVRVYKNACQNFILLKTIKVLLAN